MGQLNAFKITLKIDSANPWSNHSKKYEYNSYRQIVYLCTVRKTCKISGISIVSILICLGLYVTYGFYATNELHGINYDDSEKSSWYYSDQTNPFSFTIPEETPVFTSSNCSNSNSITGHKFTPGILKTFERILSESFVNYSFQSLNFPVRLRKANLLFPFHNFWWLFWICYMLKNARDSVG